MKLLASRFSILISSKSPKKKKKRFRFYEKKKQNISDIKEKLIKKLNAKE